MTIRPLPSWFLPVGLLLLVMWAIATAGKVTERWLMERKQAATIDGLHQDLAVQRLALQATGAALTSERATTAFLKQSLDDERFALEEAERRRRQTYQEYEALLAKQEKLEDEDPDVKAWADQPVPAAVGRLLGDSRAHYRDQDRNADADAANRVPAADADPGAKPPD